MADSATCWTLIEGAAEGSAEAREDFARYYGPVVRAYLMSRWARSVMVRELDDALQDIFLECFREGGVLGKVERRRDGGFRAFLYGVTRNVAARCEARRGARLEAALPTETAADDPALREEDLEAVFDRAWAVTCVRRAVEIQRARADSSDDGARRRVRILERRFQDGLPIRDIAVDWGEDPATLHHEYARARKEFELALREVVAFHAPSAEATDEECRELFRLLQ